MSCWCDDAVQKSQLGTVEVTVSNGAAGSPLPVPMVLKAYVPIEYRTRTGILVAQPGNIAVDKRLGKFLGQYEGWEIG